MTIGFGANDDCRDFRIGQDRLKIADESSAGVGGIFLSASVVVIPDGLNC